MKVALEERYITPTKITNEQNETSGMNSMMNTTNTCLASLRTWINLLYPVNEYDNEQFDDPPGVSFAFAKHL
jgi:hypothetical protein